MRVFVAMFMMCALHSAFAGESSVVMLPRSQGIQLTGNLHTDLFGVRYLSPVLPEDQGTFSEHRKSPWLAAGLSVVLPGAGEFYAENYWKAALFLAVDAVLWTLAYSNNKKGNDQTDFFQNYADQHWSAEKYARYSRDNFGSTIPESRRQVMQTQLIIPGTEHLPSWQRVNWNLLNELERYIGATAEGRYYSHTLPVRPEQQYYELIGKYQQFNQGWDDAPPTYVYGDPVTARFSYYANERGKANDFYNRARTFVTVAIVNHLLSAADAAWTASSFNKNLHASMHLQAIPTGIGYVQVPVARLEYSF